MIAGQNLSFSERGELSEQRLEQLARLGLESTFFSLKETGSRTVLKKSESAVLGSSLSNVVSETCDYFPRTDDILLASLNSESDYRDPSMIYASPNDSFSPAPDLACHTVRPNNSNLSPAQANRHTGWTMLSSTDSATLRNNQTSSDLDGVSSNTAQTVFPWTRLRDASVMNALYDDEDIHLHLNQCALESGLTGTLEDPNTPKYWYRFEQEQDGLGQSWLDLTHPDPKDNLMNVYADGMTMEGHVWMASECNAKRTWIRFVDMGRGQADGNMLFAWHGNTGKLEMQVSGKGSCSNLESTIVQKNCRSQLASGSNYQWLSVWNGHPGTGESCSRSLSEDGGHDLWYYASAHVEKVPGQDKGRARMYVQCYRTSGNAVDDGTSLGSQNHTRCTQGTKIRDAGSDYPGSPGLYKVVDRQFNWASSENFSAYRRPWIGKSHWLDDDFRGKMRDIRIWDRALSEDELNRPIESGEHTSSDYVSSVMGLQKCNAAGNSDEISSDISDPSFTEDCSDPSQAGLVHNETSRSLRVSPLYSHGNDRSLQFTVKEKGLGQDNVWRLVSCAWNNDAQAFRRVTRSLRFQVVGDNEPAIVEVLPN